MQIGEESSGASDKLRYPISGVVFVIEFTIWSQFVSGLPCPWRSAGGGDMRQMLGAKRGWNSNGENRP